MEYSEDTQMLVDDMESGRMTQLDLMAHVQQLDTMGEQRAAANLYALWIKHARAPGKHFALFNYAGLLQNLQRPEEALAAYEACIDLKPDFPQPYINLGLLHEKRGQETLALHTWLRLVDLCYREGTQDDEFLTMALNHIGRVQENLKNYDQAEEVLQQSLLRDPNQPGVIQHWVHIRQKACKWPVYVPLVGVSLEEMKRCTSPLAMLALSDDPAQQQQAAQSFVARMYDFKEERLCGDYHHQRLRVGYVSGDFREHAVGFLLPAMLAGHDKQAFELYGYDFSPEESTEVRTHIKSYFDHFKSIKDLNDRAAAEMIRADEIDVLIDLHGLSSGARPGIFAMHPAPRQGTYLGFIGSTGMPWLDFVITDRVAFPDDLKPFFTEKPIYVDGSFLPMVSYAAKSDQVSRQQLGIPEGQFAMGAMGNTYKITPEMFATWMRLLKRIPDSVLCLIDDNSAGTANLREQADQHGVAQDRLIFLPRTPHHNFCAQLSLLDVYLDTYPYNCGSTTNDVVHAGLPLITLCGKTMVSRMGASMLTSLGMEENIAHSYAEYEDKVIHIWSEKQFKKHTQMISEGMRTVNIGQTLKNMMQDVHFSEQPHTTSPYIKNQGLEWPPHPSKQLKINVVIATRHSTKSFWENTAAGQSLKLLKPKFIDVTVVTENHRGLPSVYNSIIRKPENENVIYVFMHDDVYLMDYFWFYRVQEALLKFKIIGIIGNTHRHPYQPSWAFKDHTFAVDDLSNFSGAVVHGKNNQPERIDVYGQPRQSVKLLDGLFLACERNTLVEHQLYFDDSFDFHFYDLDFCRQAEAKGVNCGTWDIAIRHESSGSFNSPDWLEAYKRYIEKWGS